MYLCLCSGLWNVPYITQAYLIKGSVLRSKLSQVSLYVDETMDPDMVFCRSIRDQVTYAEQLIKGEFCFISKSSQEQGLRAGDYASL